MKLPKVSLLLVVRNEEKYIGRCLESYLKQDYPPELLEVIAVDGLSEDRTKEIIEQWKPRFKEKGIQFILLDNPKKILATGWNMAIKRATGEYVCRIDGHSTINPFYIITGIKTITDKKNEDVAAVGGWYKHIGEGWFARIVCELYENRFAVGNSPFRHQPKQVRDTDTAVYAVYRKSIIVKAGLFDEKLVRNQDIALHKKIQAQGYRFLTHPEMPINYYVRSNILKLLRKAFGDGMWITLSNAAYFRHKIPFYFVCYLILFPFLFFFSIIDKFPFLTFLLSAPIVSYLLLLIYFSMKANNNSGKVGLLFLIPLYHITYGTGSMVGFLRSKLGFFRNMSI